MTHDPLQNIFIGDIMYCNMNTCWLYGNLILSCLSLPFQTDSFGNDAFNIVCAYLSIFVVMAWPMSCI